MAKPNLRELVESQGVTIDAWFYDQNNPRYEENQEILKRATNALYGDVGANLDVRNWDAIMKSSDPLTASENALAAMYSNKQYLVANTEHVLKQGYAPEQADLTYQQMEQRVGSNYNENWTSGTRFEGRIDTEDYLLTLDKLADNPAQAQAYQEAKVAAAKVDAPVVVPPAPVITPVDVPEETVIKTVDLRASIEAQISDLYRTVLKREPDQKGLQFWTDYVLTQTQGIVTQQVRNEFSRIAREQGELMTQIPAAAARAAQIKSFVSTILGRADLTDYQRAQIFKEFARINNVSVAEFAAATGFPVEVVTNYLAQPQPATEPPKRPSDLPIPRIEAAAAPTVAPAVAAIEQAVSAVSPTTLAVGALALLLLLRR